MANSYYYDFEIGSLPYKLVIHGKASDEYVVTFQVDRERLPEVHDLHKIEDPFAPTGTGNEVRVLSKVFNLVAGWVNHHKPHKLSFLGSTAKQFRVYQRVCNRLASSRGYEVVVAGQWITLERKATHE